jgi:hypothetical protein
MGNSPSSLTVPERGQDRFGGKTNAPIAVENAPRDAGI